ncbi:MAG TPA: hypothetical protein VFQ13_07480 [Anaerolineales bacterium]|nr:hypothetical protein [Anaerolineales bacterium]
MRNENANREKRENVYAEGKLAFDDHKRRGYNPYVRSSLTLAVNWWHGWDTAEEESQGKSDTQPGSRDKP